MKLLSRLIQVFTAIGMLTVVGISPVAAGVQSQAKPLISADRSVELVPEWSSQSDVIPSFGELSTDKIYPLTFGNNGMAYATYDEPSYFKTNLVAFDSNGGVKWNLQFGHVETIGQTIVGSDGNIYVSTTYDNSATEEHPIWLKDEIICVDSKGNIKWKANTDTLADPAQPLAIQSIFYSDGIIYASVMTPDVNLNGSAFSEILAYNAEDGSLEWSKRFDHLGVGPLVVTNTGVIYVSLIYQTNSVWNGWTLSYNLSEINPSESTVRTLGGGSRSPTICLGPDQTVYALLHESTYKVLTIDRTGKVKWTMDTGVSGSGYAELHQDSSGDIYVNSPEGMQSIAPNGTLRWKYSVNENTTVVDDNQPAQVANFMLIEEYDRRTGHTRLGFINRATGLELSSIPLPTWVSSLQSDAMGNLFLTFSNICKYRLTYLQTSQPSTSNISVLNNRYPKQDCVLVKGLSLGDIVKVYSTSAGGKLLGQAKATSQKGKYTATVLIKQLGSKKGRVYVTVTRSGLKESHRAMVSFGAEH